MRNLYGNRSIIPNNYYFTFDKIYENEEQVNTARNDGILIGRAVLAYAEHTVWLKTNLGYIKVAKLDNEGRFAYLEGKVLTEEDNIDLIHSNGNSYNDDGIYIINKNDYAKTQLTEEDIVYHIPQGTYPNITGSDKYATYNGNNVIDDNSQRTFLLEQYSNIVTAQKNDNDSGIKYWESVTWQYAQDIISGTTLYKEPDLAAKKYVNTTELSTEKLTTYYYPIKFDVETYQIMTDISIDDQTDNKAIDTSIQAKLSHNNKIFIRKCTFTYDIATETEEATYQYTFDSGNLKMIGTGVATLVNETTNTIFKKSIKEGWSNWEDISEQYTGYLGALNGTGFNHVNTKFTDNSTNSGQGNYLTLVDAINQLDKVIGSTNVRFKSEADISGVTADEGATKTDTIGNYSVAIPGDTRKVQLRATNLANAIIRLALNIGQFEDIEDLNNMTFSHKLKTSDNSIKNTEDDNIATINSLTDAIKIIDQMIGVYSNIDGDNNKITTEANDKRPIHDGARNKTISDTIQHILADIGEIEEIGTNTNNLAFTKNENEETTIDSDNPVSMNKNDKVKVYSIVSALRALDNMIGDYSDIDDDLGNRPVHGTKEDEAGTKTGQPISETIQHILADIGEIETLNGDNYKFDENSESDLDTNEQAKVFSIVSTLKALDKIIGNYKTIDDSSYDNRPNHLTFGNITDNLKHLAVDTGQIENTEGNNFKYSNGSDSIVIPSGKNQIESLTDVIKLLDNLIGSFDNRTDTNNFKNQSDIISILNYISNNLLGDLTGFTSTNKISYATIQNALNQLDKYLGAINNLDSQNGTDVNENLVDAINILNKLIGDCSEIVNKQDGTTINENMPIVKHIKEIYNYYEILRQMINNLGENLDILDLNVTSLMNSGGSNVNLEWGSF